MIRLLNICVIVALVAAASYVYKIKFESTRKAEQVARLRLDIRRERDAIADLRAQWSKLDNPVRIQQLAQRHLSLRIIAASSILGGRRCRRATAIAAAILWRGGLRSPRRCARPPAAWPNAHGDWRRSRPRRA